jgi:hypothetical protein
VDAFFTKFPALQNPPFHPKWKEVSLSAPLPGWTRLPVAQQWLDAHGISASNGARSRFEEFLKQSPVARNLQSDGDRDALFKQFQAWEAQNAKAQVVRQPPPQAQVR